MCKSSESPGICMSDLTISKFKVGEHFRWIRDVGYSGNMNHVSSLFILSVEATCQKLQEETLIHCQWLVSKLLNYSV